MFISNWEKENMRVSIRTLQAQMVHVMGELKALKASQKPKKAPIVRTGDAPWGYKKDGTPRKRPGRPLYKKPEIKNEQPLPV